MKKILSVLTIAAFALVAAGQIAQGAAISLYAGPNANDTTQAATIRSRMNFSTNVVNVASLDIWSQNNLATDITALIGDDAEGVQMSTGSGQIIETDTLGVNETSIVDEVSACPCGGNGTENVLEAVANDDDVAQIMDFDVATTDDVNLVNTLAMEESHENNATNRINLAVEDDLEDSAFTTNSGMKIDSLRTRTLNRATIARAGAVTVTVTP